MKKLLLYLVSVFFLSKIYGQELNKSIDRDSLMNEIVKDLPSDRKTELIETYKNGDDKSKEFMLFMLSLPESSKIEQIENFEKNKDNILILKSEYSKLVPDSLIVMIEFNQKNNIFNINESIDISISRKQGIDKIEFIDQKWNLEYNSDDLNAILKKIGWKNSTLSYIKQLLSNANCISIENGRINTIGFARSGMGKYSYLIFENKLDNNEFKEYNNGCNFIFYKDNIVLEYGNGAIGSQCFPDIK